MTSESSDTTESRRDSVKLASTCTAVERAGFRLDSGPVSLPEVARFRRCRYNPKTGSWRYPQRATLSYFVAALSEMERPRPILSEPKRVSASGVVK